MAKPPLILTLNAGSSSIKCAVYNAAPSLQRLLSAQVHRIGSADCVLSYTIDVELAQPVPASTPVPDPIAELTGTCTPPPTLPVSSAPMAAWKGHYLHPQAEPAIEGAIYPCAGEADTIAQAAAFLAHWLEEHIPFDTVAAIGHRVVHGLDHTHATLIDAHLLQQLRSTHALDPDHVPGELALIEQFQKTHPHIPQIASFDTAFHATLPDVARRLPLTRRLHDKGIRRYGFHGLAYTSVLENLMRYAHPQTVRGRCILAHLGSGASITAVRNLQSVDTSMGFTPTGGLVMGTRTGDLDPGLIPYLLQQEQLSPWAFNHLINHQSGLLGVSGTSGDMEDLLIAEATDQRAAEAIALFCYQVKKYIGSYAAVLGGLDLLAFSGGIGENAACIRSRICAGLEFLGIELDEERNQRNSQRISTDDSRIPVYVIPADEESIIVRNTANHIQQH